MQVGGRPFSIRPDEKTLSFLSLDQEGYTQAANRLVHRALAKWMGSGGNLTITANGVRVAESPEQVDQDLPLPSAAGYEERESMAPSPDRKKVFVIHGRNLEARKQMGYFLAALGVEAINFDDIRASLKGTPTIADIVKAGMDEAQGVIALFTSEEHAWTRPDYRGADAGEAVQRWQARPNVLFEAGMAFGRDRDRVVLVKLGQVSLFTDVAGVHVLSPTNDPRGHRDTLRKTLKSMGCDVDLSSSKWLHDGDFEAPVAGLTGVSPPDPFRPA